MRSAARCRMVLLWLASAGPALAAGLYPPLRPAWQAQSTQGFYSAPAVVGETVYAADVAGNVRALGLADGNEKWTFATKSQCYSGVAVANGVGYVGTVDKTLYALDLASGKPRWQKSLDGVIYATPVVANGLVTVGTGDAPTVYAFDAAAGTERWRYTLGGRMGSGLAVADGMAFVPSYDKHLHVLDLASGKRRWQFDGDTVIDSMPLVADGRVYVKLTNDSVIALDVRSGHEIWRTKPLVAQVSDEPTTWSPLAKVGDKLLLALSDGRLQALDAASGKPGWVTAAGSIKPAPPVPAGELGFVGTKEGALAAVDFAAGDTVWQWPAPQPVVPGLTTGIMWPPVVAGPWLLAASLDGHLYAFQGATDGAAWRQAMVGPLERLAAAHGGPGRIALGGLYPMGYAGCLARWGLPRDLLYDAQLADATVLRRYDLVILAGVPAGPGIAEAVQQYIASGGHALVDYSLAALPAPRVDKGADLVGRADLGTATPAGFATRGMSFSLPAWTVTDGPLAPIRLAADLVDDKCLGFLPDPGQLAEPQVLARYPASLLDVGTGKNVKVDKAGGPAAPAVVSGRLGRGRVLLCGLQVGSKSHWGADLEALILALVEVASDGRASSQLLAATPHVGYEATLGSVNRAKLDEVPEDEPPAAVGADATQAPGARGRTPRGFTLIQADPADEYDLTAQVPAHGGEVLLHYQNAESFVRLRVGPGGIAITRRTQGREQPVDSAQAVLPAGQALVLKKRCDSLLVRSGVTFLAVDLSGLPQGALCQSGLGADVAYRPAESVYFSDDFMRTDEYPGPWMTTGGKWSTAPQQNIDMGANPFAYKCDSTGGVATALAGSATWDEYQVTCAVRPSAGAGSVGLGWYAQDADNLYLLRAALRQNGRPRADGFQLVRVVGGKAVVLAECAGGLSAGQWYQLHIKAEGPWIGADLDGQRVLTAKDSTYTRGQVALRVDHAEARFDDVVATTSVLTPEGGNRVGGNAPSRAGLIDVDSWASPATDWEPDPDTTGLFWRRNSFFGDADLHFAWPHVPDGAQVDLILEGDGHDPASGYVLRLKRSGQAASVSLAEQGQDVKSITVPLAQWVQAGLHRRAGLAAGGARTARLEALIGGQSVLSAVVPALPEGGRIGFRVVGFQPKITALTVWCRNARDYTFDRAPCDWWVGSGTWDLTNRWSCVPEWSWFGGFDNHRAAVWHKQQFAGDLDVAFYAGSKMLDDKVPGYRGPNQERTGDFNLTLCGDGSDPGSGYSFRLGHEPKVGDTPYRISGCGAQLYRNGQIVARNDAFSFFRCAHNRWVDIRATKRGAIVTLYVDGQVVLDYTDPQPLAQGFVAIWTEANGILVPRVTIAFERLGQELLSLR